MILTTLQVAERLGVTDTVVKRLVRDKHLVPVNEPKPGAKKFYAKFDSRAVAEYVKAGKPGIRNGHMPGRRAAAPVAPGGPGLLTQIVERLDAMDAKLDEILRLWR